MNAALPLESLFLRASLKLRLGMRDYTDALEAMGAGYGIGSPAELRWLCQTLWCRDEEEERALEEIFKQIPPPTTDEIQAVARREAPDRIADEVRENRRQQAGEAPSGEFQPELRFAPAGQQGAGVPSPLIRQDHSETFILTARPVIPQRVLPRPGGATGWRNGAGRGWRSTLRRRWRSSAGAGSRRSL
ncbi:MAG: hypothetical protein SFV51_24220 [Bryobacteraceae bacterium]|nr:hypothetical protein [Bryobacteraceae bacterium]